MKRRVIQIANSTQLISLPRKWTQKYGIKKGDELEVEEAGDKIIVSTERGYHVEKAEFNIDNFEPMVIRYLNALYKKGIDEIKITFSKPDLIQPIQKSIGKESVGFEITEQSQGYCIIRHVSGELEDFDSVLRRTFLLLVSMSNECLETIKQEDYANLKNIAFLEEANNRFTTTCRRLLNKKGYKDYRKVGPVYYIIEELENIADQYKYLCEYLFNLKDEKLKISKEIIEAFSETNEMLALFYELFYKFSKDKVVGIGNYRKKLVPKLTNLLERKNSSVDKMFIYSVFTIMQKIFCLVGPCIIINSEELK